MRQDGKGRMVAGIGALAAALAFGLPGGGMARQPVPVQAVVPDAGGVVSALHLKDLMPVLQKEAVAQAGETAEGIFPPGQAPAWADAVRRIHDPDRLMRMLETGVADALTRHSPDRILSALDFYRQPLGQRLLALEMSARQAMLAPGAEEAAREAFAAAVARDDPRVDAIRDLIERGDLIEPNVAGALNAALAFSQGFAEGGGYPAPIPDAELLAQVAQQEDDIRAETVAWMESYLMLAYSGLSDQELARYADFGATAEGRALASVLFAGFDALFTRTAHEMGLAAAGQLTGRAL